jgi:hypothetical protein
MNLSICEDYAQHRLPSCNLMLQVNDGSFLMLDSRDLFIDSYVRDACCCWSFTVVVVAPTIGLE